MDQNKNGKQLNLLYTLLRISFGIIYLWYGVLKFFPGLSPAEELAKKTIHNLTFGLIPDDISIILLAGWEVLVGLLLLINQFPRFAIMLALVHMFCTFLPFIFLPDLTFEHLPYGFSLVGQYILKNLVFIIALYLLLLQIPKSKRV